MTTSWICHRGIRENGLIENTLEAFKLAVDRGFRVLETDLRLTQDGHIVLSHDPDFKRTLGDKRRIQDMSRAAIEALKASNGQKILFLDRFLDEFPDCAYVFDVKPETSRATLEALRAYLSQRADDTESRVTFLLWRSRDIPFVSSQFPKACRFAGENECRRAGVSVIFFGGWLAGIKQGLVYSVPPVFAGRYLFNASMVRRYHDLGALILGYLPRDISDAKAALDAGFDKILSDGIFINE